MKRYNILTLEARRKVCLSFLHNCLANQVNLSRRESVKRTRTTQHNHKHSLVPILHESISIQFLPSYSPGLKLVAKQYIELRWPCSWYSMPCFKGLALFVVTASTCFYPTLWWSYLSKIVILVQSFLLFLVFAHCVACIFNFALYVKPNLLEPKCWLAVFQINKK